MTHFWRHWLFVNMPFTKEDKILIKNLFELKWYTAKQLVREFTSKGWNIGSVYKLLQKLRVTGSVDHRLGSGRRRDDAAPTQLITLILLANWCWARKTIRRAIELSVKSLVRRAFIGRRWTVSFIKTCVSSALRSDTHNSCLTPTAKLGCRDRGCCFRSSRTMLPTSSSSRMKRCSP